jgi:hypothetical protein
MNVAWQFTARNARNRTRPVGNGMIESDGTFLNLEW